MPIYTSENRDGKLIYTGKRIVLTMVECHCYQKGNRSAVDEDGLKYIPQVSLRLAEAFERARKPPNLDFLRLGRFMSCKKPPAPVPDSRRIILNGMKYAFDASPDARIYHRSYCGLPPALEYIHNRRWRKNEFCLGMSFMLQHSQGNISYFNCGLLLSRLLPFVRKCREKKKLQLVICQTEK